MNSPEVPAFVALPALASHTENVVFGNLDLPQGFDEERLLVNIRAFNRVRSAGGLGRISVSVMDAERIDYTPAVTGIDNSGTATVGAAAHKDKRPLSKGNITFPTSVSQYDYPSVDIKIDGAKLNEKKAGDKATVIVRDPRPEARALNTAISNGLREAARHANFDLRKMGSSAWFYTVLTGGGLMSGQDIKGSLLHTAAISPIGPLVNNLAVMSVNLQAGTNVKEALARFRQSYFVGCAPDRYLAAAAIARSSRFIKARK